MPSKKSFGVTCFSIGALALISGAYFILRSSAGGPFPGRFLHLIKSIFSGTGGAEDFHMLSEFLLPLVLGILLGIYLIIIGIKLMKGTYAFPRLGVCWYAALTFLIMLQLWKAIVIRMLDSVVFVIILALILGFALIQNRQYNRLQADVCYEKSSPLSRILQWALITAAILLAADVLIAQYTATHFPGYHMEFFH